jgi:hypothetical protein
MHNGFTTENYGKYGYAGTKKITIVQTPTGGQQVSITRPPDNDLRPQPFSSALKATSRMAA